MVRRLICCSSCKRHIFSEEVVCPFCATDLRTNSVATLAGLTLLAASLSLTNCDTNSSSGSSSLPSNVQTTPTAAPDVHTLPALTRSGFPTPTPDAATETPTLDASIPTAEDANVADVTTDARTNARPKPRPPRPPSPPVVRPVYGVVRPAYGVRLRTNPELENKRIPKKDTP